MTHYFIASPYTSKDPIICEGRYYEAMAFVAWALRAQPPEPVPFSPILYCHPIAQAHNLRKDFLFWRLFNKGMMRNAVNLTVLRIPGWDESAGVLDEIEQAKEYRIPHFWADLNGDGTYTLKLA